MFMYIMGLGFFLNLPSRVALLQRMYIGGIREGLSYQRCNHAVLEPYCLLLLLFFTKTIWGGRDGHQIWWSGTEFPPLLTHAKSNPLPDGGAVVQCFTLWPLRNHES